MNTLITFESFFGNTEQIAREIAVGLGLDPDRFVRRVSEVSAAQLEGIELLVVGSATRGFNVCPDTKAFLQGIPRGALNGVDIAAFDTRIDIETVDKGILTFMVKLFGYAAEKIDKRLKQVGGTPTVAHAGFIVEDSEGPLRDGELERARKWAQSILAAR